MESESNFIIRRMRELMADRQWSIYQLAKEAKMPYSSLNNIFKRNTVPSVFTLEHICNGLGISLSQFFDYGDTLHNDTISTEEQAILRMYRTLRREDKTLLQAYLAGLAKQLPENTEQ